jgi:hypothetical protein
MSGKSTPRRQRHGRPRRSGGATPSNILDSFWFSWFNFSLIFSLINLCMDGEGIDFCWFFWWLLWSLAKQTSVLIWFYISCFLSGVSLIYVWMWIDVVVWIQSQFGPFHLTCRFGKILGIDLGDRRKSSWFSNSGWLEMNDKKLGRNVASLMLAIDRYR